MDCLIATFESDLFYSLIGLFIWNKLLFLDIHEYYKQMLGLVPDGNLSEELFQFGVQNGVSILKLFMLSYGSHIRTPPRFLMVSIE